VRLIFITLLALMLATVVGLGATWMTATRAPISARSRSAAWTARPKTGTAELIPIRAHRLPAAAMLPVGTGDGVAFSATADDRKRAARWPLRCGRERRDAGCAISGR